MIGLQEWLALKATGDFYIYLKRLSANDTGATGGHQVGLYLPSSVAEAVIPSICHIRDPHPETWIRAQISSHEFQEVDVRAVYYNTRHFGMTRDEKRITRWGKGSPLQKPDNTGALALFAFTREYGRDSKLVDVWVCRDPEQESIVEAALGEVTPGTKLHGPSKDILCGLKVAPAIPRNYHHLPSEWKCRFPSGREIITYAREHYAWSKKDTPDEKLMHRRKIEFGIFRQIEEMQAMDIIRRGFDSMAEFIELANSVSNRRKSRGGRSLEIHLEHIFLEHGLQQFSTQVTTEGNKKPDFVFPSVEAYHDASFPESQLRMLAVKSTCKDRWRQILNEADRIQLKHLFTLQEGVSVPQFEEMQRAGITLVVPAKLHIKYPEKVREHILTLGGFIAELLRLYKSA